MNTSNTAQSRFTTTTTISNINAMKSTLFTIIIILGIPIISGFATDEVYAQSREQSVQLPENIEYDIQSLNKLLSELDKESISMNQTIDSKVSEFHDYLNQLKSGELSEIEQKRVAEKAANIRARVQEDQYNYLNKVNSISSEIISLTDRLQNTDVSIEELENTNKELLKKFEEKLTAVEGRMRRGSVLALFADLPEDINADVDQLTMHYQSILEQGNRQIDFANNRTEFFKDKIEDFGGSIRENTYFLGRQAELMNITSDILLQRIKFSVENEKIVLDLLKPMESLEELTVQLSDLTGNFNIMDQQMIQLLDPAHSMQSTIIDEIRFGQYNSNNFDTRSRSQSNRSNSDMRKIHENNVYNIDKNN